MRPDRFWLLLLFVAVAAATTGCASTGRMNDPAMTSSTVVAVPGNRSDRSERSRNRRGDSDGDTRRKNADVLVELGQRYYQRGEYEVALEKLRSALEIDPRSANAHTVMAIVLETIGDTDTAGEHYRQSVRFGGRSGDVLNNYGSWLCRQSRFDEADETFRKALADPFYKTPESALANAGTCALAAGRHELGENYLRQVLDARPDDSQALLGLAEIAFAREDYMRARAFVQRAESQAPLGRTALELAARIEDRLGDARAAQDYRQRLREQGGGDI
jgi:type IV pilus assembly protein PilF